MFPAHLAYGQKGFPGLIPPNSNLHVIIELVAIMIAD
jgi:FKBP-type peptidyl-prolyl cis-trans isomerase